MKTKTLILIFSIVEILCILSIVLFWNYNGIDSTFSLTLIPLILMFWILGILVLSPFGIKNHIFEKQRQFWINGLFLIPSLIVGIIVFYHTEFAFSRCMIIAIIIPFGRWFIFTILNLILPTN